MNDFVFQNATKVIFGKNTENQVGKECAAIASRVLLHYGGGSIKKSGLYDRVMASLKAEGLEVVELSGVKPNPRLSLVKQGIELCRKERIGMILAVGGGSVIDSAKAIGVGVHYEGDVWDFYDYKCAPEIMLPVGVVLTIPAAGSETSPSSVISDEEKQLKRGLTAMCMRPEFCILNPELTFTLPPEQSANGISDMLAHTMERYFSPTKNIALTDRLLEAMMKTIIDQGPIVMNNPNDYAARAEIMLCGMVCHNDSLDVGRQTDWASHGIEHEISAITDVAHGAGLSIVFPAWMKHVYRANISRFVQFACRVFNIEQDYENPERSALAGIEALESFYKSLLLPVRLSRINLGKDRIVEMAKKATWNDQNTLGGFKKLTQSDVEAILNIAL